MRLPQIRLESTFIKTGLHIQKPTQTIEQPKAIQSIEQSKAELEINTVPGKLTIDQTEAKAQLGYKTIPRIISESAQEGKQAVLEGIGRRAREGDQFMRIENKGNPLPQIAEAYAYKEKQFGIGWIPSHGSVKLHYIKGEVQVKATPRKPIIDVQIQKPIHEYTPGDVSVYVEQKNALHIDFINLFNETI